MGKARAVGIILLLGLFTGAIGVTGTAASAHAVTIQIGDAYSRSGGTASLGIAIDSSGVPVAGFQINLAFDSDAIPHAAGMAGPVALPEEWVLDAHMAGPGDLRFVGLDFSGLGTVLSGEMLRASFILAEGIPPQSIAVKAGLAQVINADGEFLAVEVMDGVVSVVVCGDVALPYDGLIDVGDVMAILGILIGQAEPLPAQLFAGDVGVGAAGDGAIDILDAVLMIQDIVGLVSIDDCGQGLT